MIISVFFIQLKEFENVIGEKGETLKHIKQLVNSYNCLTSY